MDVLSRVDFEWSQIDKGEGSSTIYFDMKIYQHCRHGNFNALEFERTYLIDADTLMDGAFDYVRVD